jgi:hypothetical protein
MDQSFGTTLFCAYGVGLTCIYNMTTGDLETDNDGGNCPSTAVTFMGAPSTAAAPALTPWGLMSAVTLLASLGTFALRHRTRNH